ncbi:MULTISPECIES: GntR family transcriptional regulator [Microbacterium]|uniref:GntR family transcriptional regulator n=1 Tax=Microbacterium TaxID=33882 RepID=UPI0011BAE803|nr:MULTISPECIES: GntR family transcriptional regulator [Microbacterium]MCK8466309.1 GntR family transcriptional regulator [Microbacterium aurugineum]QEA29229.1 GntR family transcriptional regulator [Microbacterium sp. CBA3102]
MIITIRRDTGESPAEQVHDQIRGLITTGRLLAGDRLPSVRQLASDLSIAPGTVAKAYRLLEEDGLATSRIGSGTRVSDTASPVAGGIADAAHALAAIARAEGLTLADTQRVLRAIW